MGSGQEWKSEEEEAQRLDQRAKSRIAMQQSRERHASWLYDALADYVQHDPALRADYPCYDKQEAINRTLCRLVERMLEHEVRETGLGKQIVTYKSLLGELEQHTEHPLADTLRSR